MAIESTSLLTQIRRRTKLSQAQLAHLLNTSLVSVNKWERGAAQPSPQQAQHIVALHRQLLGAGEADQTRPAPADAFESRGSRKRHPGQGVLGSTLARVSLSAATYAPVFKRLVQTGTLGLRGHNELDELLRSHSEPAKTANNPPEVGMSGGKNTYTYDAHTYHTKVPPQAIAEIIDHYLHSKGLVLDPFAGSGMTGVAASVLGHDSILVDLSPAATFIANRFTAQVDPNAFEAGVEAVLSALDWLRKKLYTTVCRECGKETEIRYTVWSYKVLCTHCFHEFLLWDVCRSYGRTVREHKILTEFPCPACGAELKKSRLTRTVAEPVEVGYKCCGSRQQEVTRPLGDCDLQIIKELELTRPFAEGFYPTDPLPDGVNLRQPKKHGLDQLDKFYTPRNLTAMSHIWRAIHRVEALDVAAHLAYVFTSLYQRVTRLSEFRFWGGSGNTANFNVPFIFDEPNVFLTFERKARTIQDHLATTGRKYRGKVLTVVGTATSLGCLPDNSVDLVFTDPPFGANINYSEMNFLWEGWLDAHTDQTDEAIINHFQGKGLFEYQNLMTRSLKESFRVLRPGRWLILVFMNSSGAVWSALRNAVLDAGFVIKKVDSLDKQHATFKQFVSANTAGLDLVLHCLKPGTNDTPLSSRNVDTQDELTSFLNERQTQLPTNVFLHVDRAEEIDFRKLYGDWTAQCLARGTQVIDFAEFRRVALDLLNEPSQE